MGSEEIEIRDEKGRRILVNSSDEEEERRDQWDAEEPRPNGPVPPVKMLICCTRAP